MSDYQPPDPGRPYAAQAWKNKDKTKKKNKTKTKNQGISQHQRQPEYEHEFGNYHDSQGPPSVYQMMYSPRQPLLRECAGSASKNQLLGDVFRSPGPVAMPLGNGGQGRRGAICPEIESEAGSTHRERCRPVSDYHRGGIFGYQSDTSHMAGPPYDNYAYNNSTHHDYTPRPRNAQHRYRSDDQSRSRMPLRQDIHGFRNWNEDGDVVMHDASADGYAERYAGRGNGYGFDNRSSSGYVQNTSHQTYSPHYTQNTQSPSHTYRQSQYRNHLTPASDRPYVPNPNHNDFRDLRIPPGNREPGRKPFSTRQQPFRNEEFTYTPNHRVQEPLRSIYSIRNGVNEITDMLRDMSINQQYGGSGRRETRRRETRRRERGYARTQSLRRSMDGGYARVPVPEFQHVESDPCDSSFHDYPLRYGNSYGLGYRHPGRSTTNNGYDLFDDLSSDHEASNNTMSDRHDDLSNDHQHRLTARRRYDLDDLAIRHHDGIYNKDKDKDTSGYSLFDDAFRRNDNDWDRWTDDSHYDLSDCDDERVSLLRTMSSSDSDPVRNEDGRRNDGRSREYGTYDKTGNRRGDGNRRKVAARQPTDQQQTQGQGQHEKTGEPSRQTEGQGQKWDDGAYVRFAYSP